MSQTLKFYFDFMSQPSRALWIALRLAKIPHEACAVALRKREHLTEEFRQINRFQKVPCIVDADFQLSESVAIVRYLDSKQLWPDSLYAKQPIARARIDEFLEWQHMLRYYCTNYFLQLWLYPLTGRCHMPSVEQTSKLRKEMEAQLNILEQIWLEKTKFVAGPEMSIADLFGASELEQTKVTKYELQQKYPKITQWLQDVRAAANPHYEQAHRVINKAVDTQIANGGK